MIPAGGDFESAHPQTNPYLLVLRPTGRSPSGFFEFVLSPLIEVSFQRHRLARCRRRRILMPEIPGIQRVFFGGKLLGSFTWPVV